MSLSALEFVELNPARISYARACGNNNELVRVEIDVTGPLVDQGLLQDEICGWLHSKIGLLQRLASEKYDRGEFMVVDGLDAGYPPDCRRYDRGPWHDVRLSEEDLPQVRGPQLRRL